MSYGPVKGDLRFSCRDSNWVEMYCGINNICKSTNEFEIRLTILHEPTPYFTFFIITLKDGNLGANKYENSPLYLKGKRGRKVVCDTLSSQKWIKSLLDTLVQNNVFLLPGQDDLKVDDFVDDGNWYRLTFKAGTQFRTYEFNNPGVYLRRYPNVPEFGNYVNIVKTFYNLFPEESSH